MKGIFGKFSLVKLLPVLLIAPIVLIFTFFLIVPNPYLAAGSDFISYFSGASIIKNNKVNLIYDISTQKEFFEDIIYPLKGTITNRFISPPFVALLYLPFTSLNYFAAYKLFFIANLGILLIFIFLMDRNFTKLGNKYKFLIVVPFYFIPVATTLFMGQTSFLLAIIFLLIYICLNNKKSKEVGILSAALLIKPQFVIAIPFLILLVKRKKEFFIWFLGTSLFLFLASLLMAGPRALLDFLPFALSTENPEFGNRAYQMFSMHAVISYLFFKSNLTNLYSLIINFAAYIFSIYLFSKRVSKMRFKLAFIIVIFLTLVFSVHVLSHDLILLLLPIFIILNDTLKAGKINKFVLVKIKGELLIFTLFLFVLPATVTLGNTIPAAVIFIVFSALLLFKPEILEKRILSK